MISRHVMLRIVIVLGVLVAVVLMLPLAAQAGLCKNLHPDCSQGNLKWAEDCTAALGMFGALLLCSSEPQEQGAIITIDSPNDVSIYPCGQDIQFTASTDPPGREDEIQWTVPQGQSEAVSSGSGPTFTTSWTETGVKQVVAQIGDSSDDLILYLFNTPGGTATLGDILDSTPPTEPRLPSDYTWYRDHDVPADDDDGDVEG